MTTGLGSEGVWILFSMTSQSPHVTTEIHSSQTVLES